MIKYFCDAMVLPVLKRMRSHLKVTEVTPEVTEKPIYIDILYNIVTSVTPKNTVFARGEKIILGLTFRGNRGNIAKNHKAQAGFLLPLVLPLLPLSPMCYLKVINNVTDILLPLLGL